MHRSPASLPLAFALALPAAESAGQSVTHRWNFNTTGPTTHGTVIPDALRSAPATIVGADASRTAGTITLPGNTGGNVAANSISAYLDLPNGIVSSKTDMTVEIWATVVSSKNWQRLFDFGRMDTGGNGEIGNNSGAPGAGRNAQDNLMLALQRGGVLNDQLLEARLAGGNKIAANSTTATSTGTQYHFVATFQAGVGAQAATGGRFTWYRNGTQIAFLDTNFRLHQIVDVNNWLGRSQYSNDSNSNVIYNEVRLYDYALNSTQISTNTTAGPDAQFPAPTVAGDAVTMLHGQKARLDALANDSGEIARSTLAIATPPSHGTATVSADGTILYTHTDGFPASDSFFYQISNSTGQSSLGTVNVTFSPGLKIPADLSMPPAPPATAYAVPNALGSLTFSQPLCLATPPGETQRLFVCEKGGLLKVVPNVTAATPTASTFLNLAALLTSRGESIHTSSECGLLGLAFHPEYATNRYFYIFYSVNKGGQLCQRVSRFTTQAGNPNAADTASELILIEQLDQYDNHNGGDLHFGTDGFLYISVGDEGNSNDNPTFNSQLINKDLFSGILRIDIDRDMSKSVEPTPHAAIPTDSGTARFAIPKTNPYVSTALGGDWDGTYNGSTVTGTVRREFWATGLRNPWRISFDSATGALWCGDVGQGAREEIDIIVRGGNYGWVYREGTIIRTTGANHPPIPANFDTLYHKPPIHEYDRGGGYSVTGGRVYRGTGIAALVGKYVFADYGSGNVWAINLDGTNVQRLLGEGGIVGFGVDPSNQDLLLADYNDGVVRRLVSATSDATFPQTLTATGVFADLSDLSPAPGVTPYSVNLPFWSDHAIKRRWFAVPDAESRFTPSQDGLWGLPEGTVWVKHFDMEMERGVPESAKRIETRLLVKTATGAYGVSYRWNEAGTEATLVEDAGVNFTLAVTEGGNPAPQTWRIPSRAECMTCHTPQGGHALSFQTRQLNLEGDMAGFGGNQLATLHQNDFLTSDPGPPNLLPRHLRADEDVYSTEARVRSYIAVNCAYCHRSGGTAPGSWDGRPELLLAQTRLVNGSAANNGGDPLNKLVVPGDPAHSIVLHRVSATNGFTRMPPLGSNVIDDTSVDLLTEWIDGELASRQDYTAWREQHFEPDNHTDGEPGADPDRDGAGNRQEFLAGTDPLDGASALRPEFSADPPTLRFSLPVNRSFRIDASSDLAGWTPLDIPGNQPLPTAGGLMEIACPPAGESQFYRIELFEN